MPIVKRWKLTCVSWENISINIFSLLISIDRKHLFWMCKKLLSNRLSTSLSRCDSLCVPWFIICDLKLKFYSLTDHFLCLVKISNSTNFNYYLSFIIQILNICFIITHSKSRNSTINIFKDYIFNSLFYLSKFKVRVYFLVFIIVDFINKFSSSWDIKPLSKVIDTICCEDSFSLESFFVKVSSYKEDKQKTHYKYNS